MLPSVFPDQKEIARLTASMLLETNAVDFNSKTPFILSSGMPSPTYVDCRKLLGFPRVRSVLMDFLTATIMRNIGFEAFDNIAGGETAGIPFSVMVAERMTLPMTYIRKKPKGYGKNSRIEGLMQCNDRVLLVEDLATDGSSKISFVEAIRSAGAICNHTAVIFYYAIFKDADKVLQDHRITLHHLCTWWDVLKEAKTRHSFDSNTLDEVERFLKAPTNWQREYKSL